MSLRALIAAAARVLRGRPVTHEERQAAQRSLTRDPMVGAQHEMRQARFTGFRL